MAKRGNKVPGPKPSPPELTATQKRGIRLYLGYRLKEAERDLQNWKNARPHKADEYYLGQKKYFEHRVASFKWAISRIPKATAKVEQADGKEVSGNVE